MSATCTTTSITFSGERVTGCCELGRAGKSNLGAKTAEKSVWKSMRVRRYRKGGGAGARLLSVIDEEPECGSFHTVGLLHLVANAGGEVIRRLV